MNRRPFSQWESDLVIYRADTMGNAIGGPLFIGGGFPEKSNFSDGYKGEPANISGNPIPNTQQLEEVHAIELENVWMARVSGEPGEVVVSTLQLARNQPYDVVVIWTDEETGVWVKRVYFSVRIPELSMRTESQILIQKLRLEGGIMAQTSGLLSQSAPTEDAALTGVLQFNSGSGVVPVYSYDFQAKQFSLIDPSLTGLIEISSNEEYPVTILVNGMLAMGIDAEGRIHVKRLLALGGSYSTIPCAQFIAGGVPVASIGEDGTFGMVAFNEADADPMLTSEFVFEDGDEWLASLGAPGVFAAAISDDL